MKFLWDPKKNRMNRKKHGISFEEARTCFFDPMHILINDPDHSQHDEDRMILIGSSLDMRLLIVVHLDHKEDEIRIISARKATKAERQQYEEV